ncbi:hypothetical protein JOL62DRAFT_615503 [Phyllosticta paracitricarpa]|uniref:Uncharacterized protein n=1 Tax=Phyllosticta paracitricarpa TaxID=2016321 RepID=A0ABR1MVV4_9PEZI
MVRFHRFVHQLSDHRRPQDPNDEVEERGEDEEALGVALLDNDADATEDAGCVLPRIEEEATADAARVLLNKDEDANEDVARLLLQDEDAAEDTAWEPPTTEEEDDKPSSVPQKPHWEQQGPLGAFSHVCPPALGPHAPAGNVDAGAVDEGCVALEDTTDRREEDGLDDTAGDAVEESTVDELEKALVYDDVELQMPKSGWQPAPQKPAPVPQ